MRQFRRLKVSFVSVGRYRYTLYMYIADEKIKYTLKKDWVSTTKNTRNTPNVNKKP